MDAMLTTEYDGCGRCLVGVRRLSRKSDASSSPERQEAQVLKATAAVGGHIIAWADDWEVSGATDPLTRAGLGPWLLDQKGPYSGIVGAAVDRIGRNQRDVLNTAWLIHDKGRLLVTYGHEGPWNLDDATDEMRLSMESFGAQVELRAIQKRNREDTERARSKGEVKQKPPYGYMYVRVNLAGKVDHVAIDEVAAPIIRDVARRILTDKTGKITPTTEARRLNRAGVLSPSDRKAQIYGRPIKGKTWSAPSLTYILKGEAALGYLTHKGRAVIGSDGHPVRLAKPLWDRATHDALCEKLTPKSPVVRAPSKAHLLATIAFCGNCNVRLYAGSATADHRTYACKARLKGFAAGKDCQPAPAIYKRILDEAVTDWFRSRYGSGMVMERRFIPGTGYAARIKELEADRKRLRGDRAAGLYDAEDDATWYRNEYSRMGGEIEKLKKLPDIPGGMKLVPTGKTVAEKWSEATSDADRRLMLAEFGVRVTVNPRGSQQRYVITGDGITGGPAVDTVGAASTVGLVA